MRSNKLDLYPEIDATTLNKAEIEFDKIAQNFATQLINWKEKYHKFGARDVVSGAAQFECIKDIVGKTKG